MTTFSQSQVLDRLRGKSGPEFWAAVREMRQADSAWINRRKPQARTPEQCDAHTLRFLQRRAATPAPMLPARHAAADQGVVAFLTQAMRRQGLLEAGGTLTPRARNLLLQVPA